MAAEVPGREPGGHVAADCRARGGVHAAEKRPVTDVSAWLRGLGLGQYEAAFRDNGVDASVLPELTAEDLREIGVAAVGHRRKLLAAIAALRAGGPPIASAAEPPPAATPPGMRGPGTAPSGGR